MDEKENKKDMLDQGCEFSHKTKDVEEGENFSS